MSLDVYLTYPDEREAVYTANITHNLNRMANAAGIYKHLWRPEEIDIVYAYQLIEPLDKGLKLMLSARESYEHYNAENGWGLYEHFVPWVARYLDACKQHPAANVHVSC